MGGTALSKEPFEDVYNKFYIPIYKFFMKRLFFKEICEDLTSDVFYSCFVNYDKFDPAKASIKTWLYIVANNKLKNYYRDNKDILSLDDLDNPIDLPDTTDMEGAVFLSQMKAHLLKAMESIPEKERDVINLRYKSNLTSKEIAAKMNTTSGNVRVMLTRALKKIANYFDANGIKWG